MPKEVKLKWLYSYQTTEFDTPDGDLHDGEYSFVSDSADAVLGNYIVPDVKGFKRVKNLDVNGLTFVNIRGSKAFDVFQDPEDGKINKFPCPLQEYKDLKKKNAGPRVKSIFK